MLQNDGYVVFPHALTEQDVEYGLSCCDAAGGIQYSILKQFIDTLFFPKLKERL